MNTIWWIVFAGSLFLLVIILARSKLSGRWFVYAALHVVVAALLLYLLDSIPALHRFYIPINEVTVLTIGILGVPGLALLLAIKLTLLA